MIVTIGIDPGISGAVAFLEDGKYRAVEDIPVILKGSGTVKNEIDPMGLKKVLIAYSLPDEAVEAVLEKVGAMPGQGVSSMFSLGDSYGCCRSVVSTLGIPLHLALPSQWKKHFGLDKDKEKSRALAVRLFPDAPLHLKKHADRAEALLMARYLWETRFA